MENFLHSRSLLLEEAFFRKRDAELMAQRKKLEAIKRTKEAFAEISGIHNDRVLDKLVELQITPSILSSLVVVPLVEVAWADGKMTDREHKAVLAAAAQNGIGEGSSDYALLEAWLKHRPPERLLQAWVHYIAGVCELMDAKERRAFQGGLMTRARNVAETSGGILGIAMKISDEERRVLEVMENAFACRH